MLPERKVLPFKFFFNIYLFLNSFLKKLKEKGIVDYEGIIPGFSAVIELIKEI